MKTILLLLAVGLASAGHLPTLYKLPIFGFADSVMPWWGVRNLWSYNPYMIDNVWESPFYPLRNFGAEYLRAGGIENEWNTESGLSNVLRKPVVVVMNAKEGSGLEAYLLEHGLSSVVEYPHTRFIHGMLKSTEKVGLVLSPSYLYSSPALRAFRDMPVTKLEIPAGMKLANVVRSTARNIPYVFLVDKEVFNTLDLEGLIRFGSLGVTESSIAPIN